MHFVLTYDLAAEGLRRTEIESKILEILNPYKHVKRLSTFYIVHISSGAEWNTIWKQLSNLSQNIPERLWFIMSPMIEGGVYNGMLPSDQWEEINKLTNMD